MTIPFPLQDAVARLSIVDVVLKNITTALGQNVFPGLNVTPTDDASFQLLLPTCTSFTTFDSPDKSDPRVDLYEVKAGVRIFRGPARDISALSQEEINESLLATIEANFLVSYWEQQDQSGGYLDENALNHFGAANVPHNVWPYWRELVQSACSRMGLPRAVLPSYKLKKKDLEPPKAEIMDTPPQISNG